MESDTGDNVGNLKMLCRVEETRHKRTNTTLTGNTSVGKLRHTKQTRGYQRLRTGETGLLLNGYRFQFGLMKILDLHRGDSCLTQPSDYGDCNSGY